MEANLLNVLVCPVCKSKLNYKKGDEELICKSDKIAFPIRDGIPIMLESEARALDGTN